uniref:Pyruvate dehydrogenase E1 component subunit alpha n=1 Tax=Arcella intermedia TaxID=1963864 RepID=A0A6B2L6Z5_9EUKA
MNLFQTSQRWYSQAQDSKPVEIEIQRPFLLHRLENGPSQTTVTSRGELLDFFRQMSLIRRVEIAADITYKQRMIRGFLHLYNGQEAVAVGLDHNLTKEDHTITAYRCHGWLLTKRGGGNPKSVMAELFGRRSGCSGGKGGSMHLYNVESNFWGGNGIVGAQVPLGGGIALAMKYLKKQNVCLTAMGDGAANQGQVYETFNLAALHKVPAIFLVENNRYGMGTSVERASATPFFYTRGDYIPGVQFDGMNVLAAKEAGKFAREYALQHGPIVLEAITYRYKGHSMSDPGTTYRTREEVDGVQKSSDPISQVHHWLVENNLATEKELQEITEEIKQQVEEAVAWATQAPNPTKEDLYSDVYVEPTPVRGIELTNP